MSSLIAGACGVTQPASRGELSVLAAPSYQCIHSADLRVTGTVTSQAAPAEPCTRR